MVRVDVDEEGGFPIDKNQQQQEGDEQEGDVKGDEQEGDEQGCCNIFHYHVSRWMPTEALREKYLERANCRPPPIFIVLISIGELAVFIYYVVRSPQKTWLTLDDSIWKSPLTYNPALRQQAWRFISYMFVHAGIEHILVNLLLQLLLGIPLELVHKGFEVGMVYLGGVLAGSLASSIFDPCVTLVGASGGAYALVGGYFMNALVDEDKTILLTIFRLLVIAIIAGTDVGFALYRRFLTPQAGRKVSFVAHIGGTIAGMGIGYVFFCKYDRELLKDPRFWFCIVAYIVFLIFAAFFNIFLSPAPH